MSQVNLTTRIATPDDVKILLSLIRSAYRGEESRKGWTTEADLVADDRIDEAGVLAKITASNGIILLATTDSGALIACCELIKRDSDLGYFGLFAVDPNQQGGGLGRRMLQMAENYARETLDVKKLEMTVIGVRVELISWYVRRGYTVTGEQRPFPYEHLVNDQVGKTRNDLYFDVLVKDMIAVA
ncbi:putative acetyltransferase [Microthyrium microscopicum]|uniref:Putative acetyltransferase n=1 Tax=Microthyrium microscopicum TaxID=703497 RepID=A0A6A6TWE9_9PEZI|nr:putative acetyltransferase [Microthyrium microscopicum]